MKGDRYKEILTGPYVRTNTLEAARLLVKNLFPEMYMEGSTGFERTFWIRENDEPKLIAHTWMTGRTKEVWHVRIIEYGVVQRG